MPWPTAVSGIASGAGGIARRPNTTAANSPPVASTVARTPRTDSTDATENVSSATAGGVASAATRSPSLWVTPNTSGSTTLSTPNMARPYISDASQRRSMITLSNTRSMVETTAHARSTGAIHQFHDASDQVALAPYSGTRKKNICW